MAAWSTPTTRRSPAGPATSRRRPGCPGRVYDHDEVGYNYRLTNLAAALGVAQLEQLDELLGARRENARATTPPSATSPGLEPAARAAWADPSFWLYTARLPSPTPWNATGSSMHWARPASTPVRSGRPSTGRALRGRARLGGAVADRIFEAAFSLPSSSTLQAVDRERVVDGLAAALISTS